MLAPNHRLRIPSARVHRVGRPIHVPFSQGRRRDQARLQDGGSREGECRGKRVRGRGRPRPSGGRTAGPTDVTEHLDLAQQHVRPGDTVVGPGVRRAARPHSAPRRSGGHNRSAEVLCRHPRGLQPDRADCRRARRGLLLRGGHQCAFARRRSTADPPGQPFPPCPPCCAGSAARRRGAGAGLAGRRRRLPPVGSRRRLFRRRHRHGPGCPGRDQPERAGHQRLAAVGSRIVRRRRAQRCAAG